MIGDDELILRAKETLNPRDLSPRAQAGHVACALLTDQGNVYTGVCIDTACSIGFCAEHNAIGNMVTNGENRIMTIVAVSTDGEKLSPCGRCRELILQMNFENVGTRVLLSDGRESTIEQLLPDRWTDKV